jgi:hypothetical protein
LSEQEVAFVELHVSAEEAPERMLVGFAVMETAGATLTGVGMCFFNSHPYPNAGNERHINVASITFLWP